jgi:hypothetical protein
MEQQQQSRLALMPAGLKGENPLLRNGEGCGSTFCECARHSPILATRRTGDCHDNVMVVSAVQYYHFSLFQVFLLVQSALLSH